MPAVLLRAGIASLGLLAACGEGRAKPGGPSGASVERSAARLSPPPSASAEAKKPTTCEAPACEQFDTPEAAFAKVLAESKQMTVLAFGETHAPKGSEDVTSTSKRLTEPFLGLLKERSASDLVIELAVADGSCGKEKEQKTKEATKEVTDKQKEGNQNEFVELAKRAKAAGMTPHVLRPSCADFDLVLKAGQDGVFVMLDTITRLMGDQMEKLLGAKRPLVVAYGGAMHNDVLPRAGREKWSFARRMLEKTGPGGYVELDLVVPEFIRDNPSWEGLSWFASYDRATMSKKVTLFRTGPGAWALVFAAASGGPAPKAP